MQQALQDVSNRSENDAMVVVMCADDNFALPLAVAITSIAEHLDSGDRVTIYLIDGGIQGGNRERLVDRVRRFEGRVSLIFVPADMRKLFGLKEVGYLRVATYLRLLIPGLIPLTIRKVIFLDCDLIVRRSIRALWNIDLNGAPLLAVRDHMISVVSAKDGLPETYQSLGLRADSPYFNGGVLVLDLEKWRTESIAESITHFLHANSDILRWADQDGLNAILSNRVQLLDGRWNFQFGGLGKGQRSMSAARKKQLNESFIVHYTGPYKPWNLMSMDPGRIEFAKYLFLSRWFTWFGFARFVLKCMHNQFRQSYTDRAVRGLGKLVHRQAKAR